MPKRSEFVEHAVEMMRRFGPVEAKRMFGGWGLYHQGVFSAHLVDDPPHFKTDAESRAEVEALGLKPFVFEKKGETSVTSYFQAPEDALENPDEMAAWARSAYAAALRKKKAKR